MKDLIARVLRRVSHERPPMADGPAMHLRVRLEADDLDGGWVAECIDLPGCFSQGDTPEEAVTNLIDAISGVLAVRLQANANVAMARGFDHPKQERELDLALNG